MRQTISGLSLLLLGVPAAWMFAQAPTPPDQPGPATTVAPTTPAQGTPPQFESTTTAPATNAPLETGLPQFTPDTVAPATTFPTPSVPEQRYAPPELSLAAPNSYPPALGSTVNGLLSPYPTPQAVSPLLSQLASVSPMDEETRQLVQKYRSAENDASRAEVRAEIEALTKQTFTGHIAERKKQIEAMRAQIEELAQRLAEREKLEKEIIDRRVAQLLDEPDPLDWDTAMDRGRAPGVIGATVQYGYGYPNVYQANNISNSVLPVVPPAASPVFPNNYNAQPNALPPATAMSPDWIQPNSSVNRALPSVNREARIQQLEGQRAELQRELEKLRSQQRTNAGR